MIYPLFTCSFSIEWRKIRLLIVLQWNWSVKVDHLRSKEAKCLLWLLRLLRLLGLFWVQGTWNSSTEGIPRYRGRHQLWLGIWSAYYLLEFILPRFNQQQCYRQNYFYEGNHRIYTYLISLLTVSQEIYPTFCDFKCEWFQHFGN